MDEWGSGDGERDDEAEREREGEHREVDADLFGARSEARGRRAQHANAARREQDTEYAAGQRQQQTLEAQLPIEPPLAGAERHSERELTPATHLPREAEVRDVRDGGDDEEQGCGEQQVEDRFRTRRHLVTRVHHREPQARPYRIVGWVGGVESRLERRQLRLCLRECRFSLEHGVRAHHAVITDVHHHRGRPEWAGSGRHPEVVFVRIARERRQDTDDAMDLVVHGERGADHRRIAMELIHPELVAEQDNGWRADRLFTRQERAAEKRLHAEHGEELVGNDAGLNAERIAVAIQLEEHAVVLGDRAHRARLLIEVLDLAHTETFVIALRGRLCDVDESIPSADGKSSE